MNAFKFAGKTVVVNDQNSAEIKRATANIKNLDIEEIDLLNVYEVVANKNVVLTKSAIKSIEEAYAE